MFLVKIIIIDFILFYASIVVSFFSEDSLGAKHDYVFHLKFIELFQENSF